MNDDNDFLTYIDTGHGNGYTSACGVVPNKSCASDAMFYWNDCFSPRINAGQTPIEYPPIVDSITGDSSPFGLDLPISYEEDLPVKGTVTKIEVSPTWKYTLKHRY